MAASPDVARNWGRVLVDWWFRVGPNFRIGRPGEHRSRTLPSPEPGPRDFLFGNKWGIVAFDNSSRNGEEIVLTNTWLSKIDINPEHPEASRDTSDLYRMHIRVPAVVDGIPAPVRGRLLWAQPTPRTVLIQTGGPVNPLAFPRGYLTADPESVSLTEKLAGLCINQQVTFSVIANPTICPKKVVGADGARRQSGGRRWLPPGERNDWLRTQLNKHGGLQVETVVGKNLGVKSGVQRRTGHRIAHLHHLFTGTATVLDPDQVRALVRQGVGHGRAFGCGLLVIT